MNQISFKGYLSIEDFKQKKIQINRILQQKNDYQVRDILPLQIQTSQIKKLEWSDFIGIPKECYWLAYTYWNVSYSHQFSEIKNSTIQNKSVQLRSINKQQQLPQIQNQQNRNNQQRNFIIKKNVSEQKMGKVKVDVNCKLGVNSWVRVEDDLLLEHETGHYLIAWLCTLEFKRQVEQMNFQQNGYEQELKKIYQSLSKTFQTIQKNYDNETEHYLDQPKQEQWNRKIKEQLLLYQLYFSQ